MILGPETSRGFPCCIASTVSPGGWFFRHERGQHRVPDHYDPLPGNGNRHYPSRHPRAVPMTWNIVLLCIILGSCAVYTIVEIWRALR